MALKKLLTTSLFYILSALIFFIAGCINERVQFETPEDFRNFFTPKEKKVLLLSGNTLTVENAIKTAVANNPTIRAAAQSVFAAKYAYYQALSAYLPEVNANYALGHTLSRGWDLKNPPEGMLRQNNHFITSGAIRATFLLFDGFARELESIIAYQQYQQSAESSKNVRRLLIRATAFAYYDMYMANEEITIYEQDLAFQNAALQQEQQRFKSGHVSKASVLNFQILAARAKSNISNAQYRKRTALHALVSLMGYDTKSVPENLQFEKIKINDRQFIHDEDFYIALAIDNRPDLKEEKLILETADSQRRKVYAEFLPVINLFSEFSLDTYHAKYHDFRYSTAHGNQRAFAYGAEGKWNIFQGFYSINKLRRQEMLEQAALWGLNNKFLEISAEVRDACANCKNSHYQVKVYQSMAEWVKEQRDLVFSEYINGRETITRLNEAQSTLIEAQSKLVISAVEFNKSKIQLAAVTGTDMSNSPFGEQLIY